MNLESRASRRQFGRNAEKLRSRVLPGAVARKPASGASAQNQVGFPNMSPSLEQPQKHTHV